VISEREAAGILAVRGLGREQARQLLLTGAAGCGERLGRVTAYDEDSVRALAARPFVVERALAERCPHGLYVARVRRGRRVRYDEPWEVRAAALRVQPRLTEMTRALVLGVPLAARGGIPWVATVSGFVVLAATARGVSVAEDGATEFELGAAGEWCGAVEDRWFPTGPGRHWWVWDPARLPQ